MSYEIEWKPTARKEIRKLDPTVRRRVLAAVTSLAADPRPPASANLTGAPGWRRIRIGGYRVVYEVRNEILLVLVLVLVLVLRARSRGGVYRRLDE